MAKRARLNDEDEDALPANYVAPPQPWANDDCDAALEVRKILDAFEVGEIDTPTRFDLHRRIYQCDRWLKLGIPGARPGLGQERVTLILRCILETGNEAALCLPVVQAVDGALRLEWADKMAEALEVFDGIRLRETLEALRNLDLFDDDREFTGALERIITRKLRRALIPPPPAKGPITKEKLAAVKAHAASIRLAQVERNLELGRKLAALRDETPNNREFGAAVRKQFDLHDSNEVSGLMRVARRYADRAEVFRTTTWAVLVELASTLLSESVRREFEAKIIAGENLTARSIAVPQASGAARKSGRRGNAAAMQTRASEPCRG